MIRTRNCVPPALSANSNRASPGVPSGLHRFDTTEERGLTVSTAS
jgi:hypothetical protein